MMTIKTKPKKPVNKIIRHEKRCANWTVGSILEDIKAVGVDPEDALIETDFWDEDGKAILTYNALEYDNIRWKKKLKTYSNALHVYEKWYAANKPAIEAELKLRAMEKANKEVQLKKKLLKQKADIETKLASLDK